MSSPSSSVSSLGQSSRTPSPARSSSASTTPSTPPDSPISHFLIAHDASAAFLRSLSARLSSKDRIFHFMGEGSVKALLSHAADILVDQSIAASNNWERVKGIDGEKSVEYWCTKSVPTSVADVSESDGDDFTQLEVRSSQLSPANALNLYTEAELRSVIALPSTTTSLSLHILERPPFTFPLLSCTPSTPLNPSSNPFSIPSIPCFRELWSAWDLVTLGMTPPSMLHQKPIDLRHKPLFYIGHLPTFNAILLTRLLSIPMVEPAKYMTIFERGIDPHVDDPEHCHRHSEVPEKDEDWPVLGEVLGFRDRVRELVVKTIREMEKGERPITRRMVRTLVMMHEHEGFHIETLLYMLIQRAGTGTLPPPGFSVPSWSELSSQWDLTPLPSTPTVTLGGCTLVMGHDDTESDDLLPETAESIQGHNFGWDNESPRREIHVHPFKAEWRPITNGEFLAFYLSQSGKIPMPPSWVQDADTNEIKVRTLYGSVEMEYAKHWPCLTAYDDLFAYAQSKGGRLPTEPELRLFLDKYQISYAEGANVGFRNWHPLPATAGLAENDGRGSNGGVWEWSSTLLDTHDGFEGTTIFPGYSSDFFDGKHQVVLGASYATIPRLADRRTVRNFYQHNYPYPWVGARVVYDL